MKRFFLLAFLATCFSNLASATPVTIVAGRWPPYVDQSMVKKGLAIEIVTTAFENAGYQPTVRFEPWPRALEGVDIGIYDIVGTVWKTPEREQRFVFSEPYWVNQIKFLKKKNLPIKYQNLDDLSGYVIGTIKDYAYGDDFINSSTLIKIPQNHIIQNLSKLHDGAIDLTLGDEIAIRFELTKYMKNNNSEFEFLEKPLTQKELYIAVSKQNPNAAKIVSDFNRALLAMQKNGSFEAITEKYNYPLAQ